MNFFTHTLNLKLACALAAAVIPGAALLNAQGAAPALPASPWDVTASYAVKETVDSNVFMQDLSELANKRSLVTSVTLGAALSYQQTPAFKAVLSYSPEVVRYHSYSSEDHMTNDAAFNLSGVSGDTNWAFTNSLVWIDGSNESPVFDVANQGDIPAIGGVRLRNRRDGRVVRNGFKLTQTMGRWFLRPSFSSYVHDFRTAQHARIGEYAGYENYVDRREINTGLDVGYEVGEQTWFVLGYRYGRQVQGEVLGVESLYSNTYNRVLLGLEGSPASWLRLNVSGGPDLRSFDEEAPGFDPDEMLWYINTSASVLPSEQDTITLTLSRYEQPAFASQSIYEDIVYGLSWKHTCANRLSATLGFRIYGGDWQAPANREDWIYTPSAALTYEFHKRLRAEAAYSYDSAISRVPNKPGREFTAHLFSVSVKGSF